MRGDLRRSARGRRMRALVVGLAAAALAAALAGCASAAPDVKGVTDVSIAYGTLKVVQDGTDRLEVKADPGVAALTMARRDGNLLELGLFDDADWRVLIMWLLPRPDPAAKLEFVLHTTGATRFSANDRGRLVMDGFKADELRISTMASATVDARGLDVGALQLSMDGGSTGQVVLAGRARSAELYTNGAPVPIDDSGLMVGP